MTARRCFWLLAVLITLGAALRFYAIGAKTVWLDEAFSIWMASHPLADVWRMLVRLDQHPPLYYSLLHGWQRLFGDLQASVRAFSALCSTLALPFFYGATRRFFDRPTGLLATFILAIAPFHVRFAQETRMYALLSLTAALALYFLARILFDDPDGHRWRRRWLWLSLAVAQAATMLTHNTAAVFFPVALNVPILAAIYIRRRHGTTSSLPALNEDGFLWRWFVTQGLALLLWLPWARPFVLQSAMVDRWFWIQSPTARVIWETFRSFNTAFILDWLPGQAVWDWLYWLLALLGVIWLRRTPARAWLLLSLCLTPIIGELLVSLRRPIFYDRTLIWATLPYTMLVGAGIRSLGGLAERTVAATARPARFIVVRAVQAAALAMIVVVSSVALWTYYVHFQKEDWAKAADYVVQQSAPSDVLLFNASWVQIPFEYYFRHYDTGAELRGLPADLFDRGELEPQMMAGDLPRLQSLVAGRERVWLIYSHDRYTDPDGLIPAELSRLMRQVDQQEFVGLKIMQFAERP